MLKYNEKKYFRSKFWRESKRPMIFFFSFFIISIGFQSAGRSDSVRINSGVDSSAVSSALSLDTSAEATGQSDVDDEGWLAVIGSFDPTKDGYRSAVTFVSDTQRGFDLLGERLPEPRIWRTEVSNHYAVTLGGQMSWVQANTHAATARTLGIARDAFAQLNRQWQAADPPAPFIEDCKVLSDFTVFAHLGEIATGGESAPAPRLREGIHSLITGLGGEVKFDTGVDEVFRVAYARDNSDAQYAANWLAHGLAEIIASVLGDNSLHIPHLLDTDGVDSTHLQIWLSPPVVAVLMETEIPEEWTVERRCERLSQLGPPAWR